MFFKLKSVLLAVIVALLIASTIGCEPRRKRPYGFVSLGKIEELKRPSSFFSDKGLLLRYDESGFSVMSLLCTHDLSPLELKQIGDTSALSSKLTSSSYSLEGKVINGPSTIDLPFYELVAAQSAPDKPIDSLYARIGEEKPKEWRLPITK